MSDTPRTDQLDYGMLPDCQPSVIYDCMFRHARILERELNEARAEAATWKANHDNQVALKSAIIQRPDLGDRSERVQSLIQERDALCKALELIEDRFVDGENTYDDWLYMGVTARQALAKIKNHLK